MTQITVPDVPTFKEYSVVISSTGPFIVPFAFFGQDDVQATVTDAVGAITNLVVTTDFTFTTLDVPVGQEGAGYEGGEITLNVAIGADGATTIRIFRSTIVDRTANYPNTGPLLMSLLNDEQNYQTMVMQELSSLINADQVGLNTIDIANQADLIADLTANDPGGSYALLTNLISVLNGKGAALIGIEDAAGDFAGTNVEAVIVELKAEVDANLSSAADASDLASVANGLGASLIGVEDVAADFTGTDVEAVLAEIAVIINAAPSYEIKVKTADESVTSSITLQDDNHLAGFAIAQNSRYAITGFLDYDQNVGDLRLAFSYTVSPSRRHYQVHGVAEDGTTDDDTDNAGVDLLLTALTDNVNASVFISGMVTFGAVGSGTGKLTWAQGTLSGNATTIKEGSWLKFEKI